MFEDKATTPLEVRLKRATGVVEGSILSIRIGDSRRQGPLSVGTCLKFPTRRQDANPFKVDVLAPIANGRLLLTPKEDVYKVQLGGMSLELEVSSAMPKVEDAAADMDMLLQGVKSEKTKEATAREYIKKHDLRGCLQSLLQSVVVDRPEDPFRYMAEKLRPGFMAAQDQKIDVDTAKSHIGHGRPASASTSCTSTENSSRPPSAATHNLQSNSTTYSSRPPSAASLPDSALAAAAVGSRPISAKTNAVVTSSNFAGEFQSICEDPPAEWQRSEVHNCGVADPAREGDSIEEKAVEQRKLLEEQYMRVHCRSHPGDHRPRPPIRDE